jgi:hypothetical protein
VAIHIKDTGVHPLDIPIQSRDVHTEGNRGDRAQGITSDARQFSQNIQVARNFAIALFYDDLRSFVQISRTAVIAKSLPAIQHIPLRSLCQRTDVRE